MRYSNNSQNVTPIEMLPELEDLEKGREVPTSQCCVVQEVTLVLNSSLCNELVN